MNASGPFQNEREARESVRHIIDPAIYAQSIVQGNRALLRGAVTPAGIDLGAYDRQILDWLADYEPATCAVVAGLITRATDALSPGYALTLGQAVADAIAWRKEHYGDGSEQEGLYLSAARALRIPGDVSQGPGAWHPDAEEGQ